MISKATVQECFVYITLPDTTEFVTAGRFVLEPDRTGVPVGRFVYGRTYLARPDAVSPAYDLTPAMPISMERRDLAMGCGDWGRYANATNMLSQCARFHLERDEAEAIIKDMVRQVEETWYETARRAGLSEKDCETIKSAFSYPGFRLPIASREVV